MSTERQYDEIMAADHSSSSSTIDLECHESLPPRLSNYQQDKTQHLTFNRSDFPPLLTDSNVILYLINDEDRKVRDMQRRNACKTLDNELASMAQAQAQRKKNSKSTNLNNTSPSKRIKRPPKEKFLEVNISTIQGGVILDPIASPPQRKRNTSVTSSQKPTKSPPKMSLVQSTLAPPIVSQPLYSWLPLQLGKELGTPAFNQFFNSSEASTRRHERYNPEDMLQLLETMRAKTVLPPSDSFLEKVVLERNATNKSFRYLKDISLESRLSKLYEFMCTQDSDDGILFRRTKMCMSALECSEKLASFENETFRLNYREQQILEKSKSVRELLTKWKAQAVSQSNFHSDDERFSTDDDEPEDPNTHSASASSIQKSAIKLVDAFPNK